MKPVFHRCNKNPILTVGDVPISAEAVLNPGAADTHVCLATVGPGDLLETLEPV